MRAAREFFGALLVLGIVAVFLVVAVNVAYGQTPIVDVPLDTIYRGEPGSIHPVVTVPATAGLTCTARLTDRNNESIHPDTNVLVGPITFADVERASFTAETQAFTTTGDVPVAVQVGGDEVASMGLDLFLECGFPPTTDPPPSSTMITTTTTDTTLPPVTTSTLSPPPEGPVPAGGGAMAAQGGSGWYWILGGLAFLGLSALAWAFVAGGTRKETPWR